MTNFEIIDYCKTFKALFHPSKLSSNVVKINYIWLEKEWWDLIKMK